MLMFTLWGLPDGPKVFETQDAAITAARDARLDAFEIRDETRDVQVYVEYPEPNWC